MLNETYTRLLEKSKEQLVIVSFTAVWSGSSRILTSSLKQINTENEHLLVAEVDIESSQQLFSELGLSHVPTTLLLRDQEIIDLFTGPISKRRIREKIEAATR